MEMRLMNDVNEIHGPNVKREYGYEVDHPPNKIRIIKRVLEYVNMEREELMKIIEETYKAMQDKSI